jgi:hypothetical protein
VANPTVSVAFYRASFTKTAVGKKTPKNVKKALDAAS